VAEDGQAERAMNRPFGQYGASYAPGFALDSTSLLPGEATTTLESTLNRYISKPVTTEIDSMMRIGTAANKAATAAAVAKAIPTSRTVNASPSPSGYAELLIPRSGGTDTGLLPMGGTGGDDTMTQVITGVAVGAAFLLTVGLLVRLVRS
jgi:hypothetical protein